MSNLDLSGISIGFQCDLTERELLVIRAFSESIHSIVFGCFSPKKTFELFLCVSGSDGQLDFDFMDSAVSFKNSELMDDGLYPIPPFIVRSSTSKRLHRVDDIIPIEPGTFCMPRSDWKPLSECGIDSQNLADYYFMTYGINVNQKQSMFLSPLGNLLTPVELSPSATSLPQLNGSDNNATNQVYLVPQLVRSSPLTEIISHLTCIPRLLFWIERGIIARDVAQTIGLDLEAFCTDKKVIDAIIPSEFVEYQSQCVSLVSIALTCPGADLAYDYERLEWLGDCVLRIVVFDELRASSNAINTNQILSNERIGRLCLDHCPKIAKMCIVSTKPTLRNPAACRNEIRNLRIIADVVEALICVCYLVSNVPGAIKAARCLGILNHDQLKGSFDIPPSVRLEQSLIALKNTPVSASRGQLESMRNSLLESIHVSNRK